ncbi:MAG: hypothetical protein HC910_21975 [Spirulinaceae cyanobacterium SM2_1_0]|nr:hypothetical protein [Spirulinaceae cyanobacterium SM2_1_0]
MPRTLSKLTAIALRCQPAVLTWRSSQSSDWESNVSTLEQEKANEVETFKNI